MTAATATTVAQLASLILAAAENKPESVPNKDILFISIAGIAGSGKTTLASKLVDEMNKTLATCGKFDSSSYKIAQHVSMDGYHFPKARLKEFEDHQLAFARRGAEFTFNSTKLLGDIRRIQRSTTGDVFALPSFDHTVGDPVEGDVVIDTRKTRIIVFEGLYLQLDRDVWRDIHSLMHISIFISIDRQIAFERLVQRHVLCGLGERVRSDASSPEEAARRIHSNDFVNAKVIEENRLKSSFEVKQMVFLAEAAANHGKKVFLEDEESGGGGHRMFNKFLPRNVRFTLVRLHVVAKRKLAATLAGRRQRVLLLATVAATVSILLFLSLFTSVFSRLDFGIQRGAMLSAGIYNLTANGGFKQQSLIVDGSTTTELHQQQYIPHIIHQSWKTVDVPKRFLPWQDSWRNHNPNFTYIFWTDDDNRKLIQDFYPWFLSTYDALPKTIQRVDASRIFYLHRYGGVYSDLDVQCLKPIDPLLRGHELVLGRMGPDYHYEHSIPNAWMASKPGHVFWMWCARWIMENKHLWHKSVEGTAGPIMIFSVLNAYGRHVFEEEKNGKKMDTICVADKDFIFPYSWKGDESIHEFFYNIPNTDICSANSPGFSQEKCLAAVDPNNFAYTITFWSHSWEG